VPPETFNSDTQKKDSTVRPVSTVERFLGTQVRVESKPSIISEGFSFIGDIVSAGTLHIEGQIKGTVKVDAVTIGPSGAVDGSIACARLHVKGRFKGTAECDDLQVDATATVDGFVGYKVLTAQRGANIVGELLVRR